MYVATSIFSDWEWEVHEGLWNYGAKRFHLMVMAECNNAVYILH